MLKMFENYPVLTSCETALKSPQTSIFITVPWIFPNGQIYNYNYLYGSGILSVVMLSDISTLTSLSWKHSGQT